MVTIEEIAQQRRLLDEWCREMADDNGDMEAQETMM